MQKAMQLSPARVQAGARAKSSPVALSQQALKLVSGGSPRGGWIVATETKIESPRGGW